VHCTELQLIESGGHGRSIPDSEGSKEQIMNENILDYFRKGGRLGENAFPQSLDVRRSHHTIKNLK
jgi:hypothetical protein